MVKVYGVSDDLVEIEGSSYWEEQLQVLDELADVYVMLEQLAMIASISDRALDDRITYKVGRLCGRLAEGGR